ncbi:MAG TPA: ATP-binding protein [Dehalococcoidia bacterium]|nr:ATP-binding protein [Dehalococcoidia bacterium]
MFEALRWRLTAWYVLVFCTVSVVVGLVVFIWASHRFSSEVDNAIARVNVQVLAAVHKHRQIIDADADVRSILARASLGGSADVFVLLLHPDGTVATNPSDIPLAGLPNATSVAAARQDGTNLGTYRASGQDLRVRTTAIRGSDGQLIGFVQAGKSVDSREASLQTLVIVMAGGGITGLILSAVGGLFVAGIAIRPVKRSFERQREFVADASHELRTPLAVIRVNAEAASLGADEAGAVSDIAAEATYMTRLLDDLLLLAGSDRDGIDLRIERLDLAEIARSAGRAADRLAQEARCYLQIDVAGPLLVDGDPERCREVMLILLDNAVKYTPSGGTITLRASSVGGEAVVAVSDTGIGVPPDQISRLFDRFYRVDKARSRAVGGAGLGLSIAREIMDALGGSLSIDSQPGSGTTVTMRLSLALRSHANPVASPARGAPS